MSHPEKVVVGFHQHGGQCQFVVHFLEIERQEPFLGRILHGIEPKVWRKREVFRV